MNTFFNILNTIATFALIFFCFRLGKTILKEKITFKNKKVRPQLYCVCGAFILVFVTLLYIGFA